MPTATIREREIFYTITKPSSSSPSSPGQTVIFIHGLGSTSSYFYPIIPHLTSQNHTCITFDNYGAGLSPLSASHPQTSITSIASDALALLDTLHIPRAVIVGYSMGALAALSLAATHPTRVAALICLGPINPSNADSLATLRSRIDTITSSGLDPLATTIPATAPSKSASPLVRAFIRALLLSNSPAGYLANLNALLAASEPVYPHVRAPVYILVGEEDQACPPRDAQQMYLNLGNSALSKFDFVEECGHWYCVERPEVVAGLVGEFVKAVT